MAVGGGQDATPGRRGLLAEVVTGALAWVGVGAGGGAPLADAGAVAAACTPALRFTPHLRQNLADAFSNGVRHAKHAGGKSISSKERRRMWELRLQL